MTPDDWDDNDPSTLPPAGRVPTRDDRPCDRCPRDGARVVTYAGTEMCLCETCVTLGR